MFSEATKAIEAAADALQQHIAAKGGPFVVTVKNIPVETLFRGESHTPYDAPLQYNNSPAKLGDRVINLTATGVPFGLKGTVVALHVSTAFVEVSKVIFILLFC